MSKPLKEWGVVKFLTKKLPEAAGDIVGNVAEVATGQKTIFQAVGSVLAGNKDKLSPEDIAKVYELAQLDHERYKEELKDRQDARTMQEAALQQGDTFAKRFIYYYAAGMTGLVFTIVIMLFFVEIPEGNQRIIDMVLGVIVGTGLVGVFQFFFGSSSGSKNKEGIIKTFIEKVR